ncbi:hypothetical protein CHK_1588 [Christensenella hongkongensis]|uniref:Uncharacterized protein n=1 Tax=Christensenella hongkongensis TaxID=270498 RepID=A0A0M2NJQ7_9FIRM|nr:hypothetical protein CHK_1588 [Christensenella hongkongensis]
MTAIFCYFERLFSQRFSLAGNPLRNAVFSIAIVFTAVVKWI